MGLMAGGCAGLALLGWLQAPLWPSLTPGQEAPSAPRAPQPGQLLHPLVVDLAAGDGPAAAPADWVLETVALELDGQPLVAEQPAAAAPSPLWQGEVVPGPHTLVTLLLFRRPGAGEDAAGALVRVERPSVFHARPGRPLALTLSRSP